MVGGRSYLFQPPRRAVGPSGINPGFPGLSRYQGWVTHVLLTRSPLSPDPKVWFSLDLHVLSAPPAFVLSQDQTLREGLVPLRRGAIFTSSLCSVRAVAQRSRSEERDEDFLSPSGPSEDDPASSRSRRERLLLSFQRPVALQAVKKASDSRQRPPMERIVANTSRAGRLLGRGR